MVSRVNTDAVGMCVSAVSAAQHAASVESASACSPLDEKADAINAVAMLISGHLSRSAPLRPGSKTSARPTLPPSLP